MATGTQIGYKTETTYGTPATPVDRFIPILGGGGDVYDREILVSDAVRGGRLLRSPSDEAFGGETVSFDAQHEIYRDNMGFLFEAIIGNASTTGAGPYVHEFTPGSLAGKGTTIQMGVDRVDGTIDPYTMAGCKAASAQIGLQVGELAQLGIDWIGQSFDDQAVLAAASYADTQPYSYVEGTIEYPKATGICVQQISIDLNNTLNDGTRCIGNSQIKEPVEIGYREYTGTMEMEYLDKTFLDAWLAGNVAVLYLKLESGTDLLEIEGEVKFRGGFPNLAVDDLTTQTIPFEFLSDTDDATAFTLTYTSDDVNP